MTLTTGSRLGPYEVLGLIGAGGMAEVYKARDTRLDRIVAIKVLSGGLSADERHRVRFAREAKTIAGLTHPNICTLYDVGEHGGSMFLVMEHLEGHTLAHRLEQGNIQVSHVLTIATQIADALAAAHQQGIIHRDLKPGNVMLTNIGAKLLDFGVAKLIDLGDRSAGAQELLSASTCTSLTAEGAILGTLQYMSPEQLEGKPATARSDLWAFGAVLYEMLTGKPAFEASSAASLVAAILEREAPMVSVLQPTTPPGLERLVLQCLAKSPNERPDTSHDVANELRRMRDAKLGSAIARVQGRGYVAKSSLAVAALALVALFAAGLPDNPSDASLERRASSSAAPDPTDISEALFDAISRSAYAYEQAASREKQPDVSQPIVSQLTARAGREAYPSLSPDGKWIVYTGDAAENDDIYLQSVTGQLTINLTKDSSDDDSQPAFSPDGEQIAFRSERDGGGLFVMGRTGESVRRVSRSGFHPNWSPDGQSLVFSPVAVSLSPHFLSPIAEKLVAGGYIGIVNLRDGMKRFVPGIDGFQPAWSPKGELIAFSRISAPDRQTDIWTVRAEGGTPIPVTDDRAVDWNPVWSPSGDYLYFSSDRGGTMNVWRVRVEPHSGVALSRPESLSLPSPYVAHLSIAQNASTMAFTATLPTRDVQRAAFDPARETLRRDLSSVSTGGTRFFASGGVHAAPDMKTIAFSTFFPTEQIFTARPDFSNVLELTNGGAMDGHPRWAPNGQEIAFYSERSGAPNIWIVRRDGTMMRQLTHYKSGETARVSTFAWSPDGRYLVYGEPLTKRLVIVASLQSGNTPSPRFMPPPDNIGTFFEPSSWSPDGKWIAGHSRFNQRKGIGIYSTESSRYQPLAPFGEWPVWLNDNRRLLFSAQGKLYIIDRDKKRPRELLSVPGEHFRDINLSPDNREVFFVRQALQADVWLVNRSQQ